MADIMNLGKVIDAGFHRDVAHGGLLSKTILLGSRELFLALTITSVVASASAQSHSEADRAFDSALTARESGDYETAVEAFQTILSTNPSLNRVRAELALTYFQSLDLGPAKAEVEKLLADPSLPEAVRQNLQRLLAAIKKEAEPHVFSPFVTFGYGHDSNINVGPSTDAVQIGGALIPLALGALPQTANYVSVHGGFAYRYLSPSPATIAGSQATLLWQSQASFYSLDYTGRGGGASDLLAWTISTGPSLIVPRKWRANLNVQYDDVSLGHVRAAHYIGLSPSITWMLFGGRTEFAIEGQVQDRRYGAANAGRNGNYQSLGATLGHALGAGILFGQVGHRGFRERTDTARFSNTGRETSVGVGARPWTSGTIYLRYSEKQSDYKDIEPGFTIARDEKERRWVAGVNHLISSGQFDGWTVGATVTETRNRSSVSLYTYDRTQTGLTLGRRF